MLFTSDHYFTFIIFYMVALRPEFKFRYAKYSSTTEFNRIFIYNKMLQSAKYYIKT